MTVHLKSVVQNKTNTLILATILLSVCTIGSQFTLIGIALQVILLGICTPLPKLLSGLISRIAIGFLLSTALWAIIALGFWFLNVPITPSWVIIVQAIVLIGLIISSAGSHSVRRVRIDRSEIVVTIVSLLSGVVILFGTFGDGPVGQQALRYATTGFDNTIHLSILQSDYQQRGYVYGPKEKVIDTMIYPDFVSYPQGWHIGASILLQSTTSLFSTFSPTKLIIFYICLQLVWYVLLIFMFHMTVITILRVLAKTITWQILFALVAFGAIAQAGIFIGLLQIGFTSFIALLVYILLLVMMAVSFTHEIIKRKLEERTLQIQSYLSLSLFIGAVISLIWTLAAPIGYLCTGVLVAYFVQHQISIRSVLRTLLKRPWLLTLDILLALVPILQMYFQVAYGLKPNQINETGGIQELSYTLLLISLVICLVWYLREKSNGLREALIGSIAGAALLSGSVYFYQYYTAGVINYYSIKLGFITLIILLAFTLPVLILYLWRHLRDVSPLIYVVFIVCLCTVLPQALSLNLSRITFATGASFHLSPYSSSQIVNEYPAIFSRNTVVIVFKQLNYEEDLITTNFLRSVTRNNNSCQTNQVADLLLRRYEALYNEITICSKRQPTNKTIVIASSLNYESLLKRFSAQSNIKILLSN